LAVTFRDYVLSEAALVGSTRRERSRAYWAARLPTLPPAPALPIDPAPSSASSSTRFVRREGGLEPNSLGGV